MARKLQVTIFDDIEHEVAVVLLSKALQEYDNAKPKNQFDTWSCGSVVLNFWRNKHSVTAHIWRRKP
jgi:hypothetical protein